MEQTPLVGQQIPAGARTVGLGWAPLLDRLHHQLAALAPSPSSRPFRLRPALTPAHVSRTKKPTISPLAGVR